MAGRRAALVTGASRGIGAAVARRLAQDGFDVAVHYHGDAAGARRTAAAVRRAGRKAIVVQADLADVASVEPLADAVAEAFPRLDCLVHNAGAYDRRAFRDLDAAAWHAQLAVNLTAPALLTRRLLPRLRGGASVVFVSSVAAARGSRKGAAYAAAKAGLLGLTRSLALELAPLRVNAVAPGYIATDLLAGDSPAKRRQREADVPLGRLGTPQDVAGVVAFLAGPDSAYVTGQVLHANGGLLAG
jgi:3-oxoacyl-[acyl-carrier protein] reductase